MQLLQICRRVDVWVRKIRLLKWGKKYDPDRPPKADGFGHDAFETYTIGNV